MSSKMDELRREYPGTLIKSGERGRYAKKAGKGGNVVVIDPDLRDLFPDSASVNKALRDYVAQRKQRRR
jgi:hypothetical protein